MADEILIRCSQCGRMINDLPLPLMVRITVGTPARERVNLEDLAAAAGDYLTSLLARSMVGGVGNAQDDLCYECFDAHFAAADEVVSRAAARLPDASKHAVGLARFATEPPPPPAPPPPAPRVPNVVRKEPRNP